MKANKTTNATKKKVNINGVAKAISEKLAKKDYNVVKVGLLEQEFAK